MGDWIVYLLPVVTFALGAGASWYLVLRRDAAEVVPRVQFEAVSGELAVARAQSAASASAQRLADATRRTGEAALAEARTVREEAAGDLARAALYTVPDPLVEAARLMVTKLDGVAAGGEWKRHNAYAALIAQFPGTPKRDLAFAIELALR